jgi:hypothetical protein
MENISEDADKHTLWVFGITMVLTWMAIWVLFTKLVL